MYIKVFTFAIITLVKFMTKVIVVGGGASGLVAAIQAVKKGADVILLERNDSLGKKILVTGNGKCNYWNEDQDVRHYHSSNQNLLNSFLTEENKKKVMHFFEDIGVIPKIKNGYYYPYSNQAVSMKAVLMNEMQALSIQVITNAFVKKIEKENDQFYVFTNENKYFADVVILATGSKAAPKTGSDGNGYVLAESLGHQLIPVLPSLTQVYGNGSYYKQWNGIRVDAKLSLYENDKLIKEESGELHLTDYGISGICTFNLSGAISKGLSTNKKEEISINFIPDLNIKDTASFVAWLDERNAKLKNRTIDQLFDGFVHYKLVFLFLALTHIDSSVYWEDLTMEKKLTFASYFLKHSLIVLKTSDFEKAQVCSGGVSLEEVNMETMESLKVKNLYFAGELLDVDGDCGGYNLGFAWMSGIVAGENAGEVK